MEYQLKSRGIIPVLSERNPYRYIGSEVQRSILSGTRKKKKRGQRGGILPITAAISGAMALRRRLRRRRQKGGIITFFTPSLVAAAKTLRRRYSTRRKQRGGNIFAGAAKLGVGLGKRKDYRRFSLSGFSDPGYRRLPRPWER